MAEITQEWIERIRLEIERSEHEIETDAWHNGEEFDAEDHIGPLSLFDQRALLDSLTRAQQEIADLKKALAELVRRAVATEQIVRDRADKKRLGHNPSWVKAASISALLAPCPPGETGGTTSESAFDSLGSHADTGPGPTSDRRLGADGPDRS